MLLHSTDTFVPEAVEIVTDSSTGNRSLFSRAGFEGGAVISRFYWKAIHVKPSYLTIQIGEKQHISLLPSYLACVNHSCDPNAFFDTDRKQLVCIKPIRAGDEILFFYPSSEWCMDKPFDCHCKSVHCLQRIAGAKYLNPDEQKRYRFTGFIQKKLATIYESSSQQKQL